MEYYGRGVIKPRLSQFFVIRGTSDFMPSENKKKSIRLSPKLLQAAELYCRMFDKSFNGLMSEALEAQLAPFLVALETAETLGISVEKLKEDPPNS